MTVVASMVGGLVTAGSAVAYVAVTDRANRETRQKVTALEMAVPPMATDIAVTRTKVDIMYTLMTQEASGRP